MAENHGQSGGILWLLDLIEGPHRGAAEYDWRTRFHLPVTEVGVSMPLDEAARLGIVLAQDPTSMIHTAINDEWRFPMSREAFAMLDVFDAIRRGYVDPKEFKPHGGRPFDMPDDERTTTRRGNAAGRTREQVVEILAAHGHGVN